MTKKLKFYLKGYFCHMKVYKKLFLCTLIYLNVIPLMCKMKFSMKTPTRLVVFKAVLIALLVVQKADAASFDPPPTKVETAFKEQYPSVDDVKWAKSDHTFIAQFKENNTLMKISFDTLGNVIESETEIEVADLPEKVVLYITTQDETAKIYKAYKIVKRDRHKVMYDVVAKIHYKKTKITISNDGYLTSR